MNIKEKVKLKGLDALLVFLGSLLGLYIYSKNSSHLYNLIQLLNVNEEKTNQIQGFVFSFFVAVGYILVLLLVWLLKEVTSSYLRPVIKVSFYDLKDRETSVVSFEEFPEEPQYIKMSFLARFSKFQLYVLKNILNARIEVSINPKMCAIELYEGFIGNDKEYKIENQSLYFNLFSKFTSSRVQKPLYIEMNLLLVQPAEGEIIVTLDLTQKPKFIRFIFEKYCKIKISSFNIEI